ncbi:MAG: hypothetical protein CW346_01505 [Bacillaceae bacterium]|nr:hypothetical protein [Bacillaceae bacterium]
MAPPSRQNQAGDHPKTIRCARKGETQPKGKAPAPAESAGKYAGGRPGSPARVSRKKSPSIPHGEAILPIKPALRGGTARRTSRQTKPPSD